MSEIKTGDRVSIKKPKNVSEWPVWVKGMDQTDGDVITVSVVREGWGGNHVFTYKGWAYNPRWCEKVKEEMTLAQWEKMSPQERLEWNRPAFEALVSARDQYEQVVEFLSDSGNWVKSASIDLTVPIRPLKKSTDPPKELWFVASGQGTLTKARFEKQEDAEEAAKRCQDTFVVRVVKYVIAE